MDDTDRLDPFNLGLGQFASSSFSSTNSITANPIRSQAQKRKVIAEIVTLLDEKRTGLNAIQIKEIFQVEAGEGKNSLLNDLISNAKINYDAQRALFFYKPTFDGVTEMKELDRLIMSQPYGILQEDIYDCYHQAKYDLQKLLENGRVISVENLEKKKAVIFPLDKQHSTLLVDDDIKQAWHSVQVPHNAAELEQILHSMGHISADELSSDHISVARRAQVARKRKDTDGLTPGGYRKRRTAVTNVHLLQNNDYHFLQTLQTGK